MNPNVNDTYWMRHCEIAAEASTCRVHVACVLVHRNQLVGIGYNGSLHHDHHCSDVGCLFVETQVAGSSNSGKSCIRTVHAEMNAILKCTVRGSKEGGWITAYSTYQPCLNCFKALVQIGVRRIVYEKVYRDEWRDKLYHALSDEVALDEGLRMIKFSETPTDFIGNL